MNFLHRLREPDQLRFAHGNPHPWVEEMARGLGWTEKPSHLALSHCVHTDHLQPAALLCLVSSQRCRRCLCHPRRLPTSLPRCCKPLVNTTQYVTSSKTNTPPDTLYMAVECSAVRTHKFLQHWLAFIVQGRLDISISGVLGELCTFEFFWLLWLHLWVLSYRQCSACMYARSTFPRGSPSHPICLCIMTLH